MDQASFIDFICKGRDCTKSSAKTHWYTVANAYKMTGRKWNNKIPKTSKWINEKLLAKMKESMTDTKLRNTLSTLVVYLKLTKSVKKKIRFFTDEMYTAAKTVRNKPPGKRSSKQEKLWIGKEQLQQFHLDTHLEALKLMRKKYFPESSKRSTTAPSQRAGTRPLERCAKDPRLGGPVFTDEFAEVKLV